MKKLINFKRERDLGVIITDAFGFIRTEWKQLFTYIFKITWPFLVLSLVVLVIYFYAIKGNLDALVNNSVKMGPFALFSGSSLIYGFFLLIVVLTIYTLLQLIVSYYVKSYITNEGQANYDEILQGVKAKFWTTLGYLIVTYMISTLGTFFCILPGIYLFIVFSMGVYIIVFQDKNIGETISHCFVLIKDKWFDTFGVIIVVSILIGIIGYVFSIPGLIYYLVRIVTSISKSDPTAVFSLFSDPIYLALNILSYAGRFLLSAITVVAIALVYFDLNEQKFRTGTIETIDNLGKN